MPPFLDIHKHVSGLTTDVAETARQKGLATQDKHNVEYLKCWLNHRTGDVMCLVEARSREAVIPVHREAHGGLR
jgi:hypothetical protein